VQIANILFKRAINTLLILQQLFIEKKNFERFLKL